MKPLRSQMQPGLSLVATPIGNLGDITRRALAALESADLILCEDTRVTAKLLSHYGIKTPALSYHEHNASARRPKIMEALAQGKRVALVSDAGTPLISDPGYKLVREAIERGFPVSALPGASSVLAALCLSGLPSDRFCFAGFLPPKKQARAKEIKALAPVPATLILFESAKRLAATLRSLQEGLGDRAAAVARELTKLHEECRRGRLSELAAHYEAAGAPRGEIVLIIAPPDAEGDARADPEAALKALLKTHSVKDAAALAAEMTGKPRRELYALALRLLS